MSPVRILLADANPNFRGCAAAYLASRPGLCLVAEVASEEEAHRVMGRTEVDLLLLDAGDGAGFPAGLVAARRLCHAASAPRVVVLTQQDWPAYRRLCAEAGVDGLVDKAELATALPLLLERFFPDRRSASYSAAA